MTYNQIVKWATIFVPFSKARDLTHDLWLHLNKQHMNLFTVSPRTVYVYMYNLHRNQVYNSISNRNKYWFLDIDKHQITRGPNPEQILIGKELEETFSPYLRLSLEGYTQEEIGMKVGFSRRTVNKKINNELRKIIR